VCDALKIRAKKGANYVHGEWKFEVTAKDLNAMTEMRMTKGTGSEKAKRGRISSAQTLLQCIFVHQVTLLYNAADAKKGKSREEKFSGAHQYAGQRPATKEGPRPAVGCSGRCFFGLGSSVGR
jgi:hypothetical protein